MCCNCPNKQITVDVNSLKDQEAIVNKVNEILGLTNLNKNCREVNQRLSATLGKFLEGLLSRDWDPKDDLVSVSVDVVIQKEGIGLINFQENFGASLNSLRK